MSIKRVQRFSAFLSRPKMSFFGSSAKSASISETVERSLEVWSKWIHPLNHLVNAVVSCCLYRVLIRILTTAPEIVKQTGSEQLAFSPMDDVIQSENARNYQKSIGVNKSIVCPFPFIRHWIAVYTFECTFLCHIIMLQCIGCLVLLYWERLQHIFHREWIITTLWQMVLKTANVSAFYCPVSLSC